MMNDIKRVGQILFFPERGENGEWVGVISESSEQTKEICVLTMGVELTEKNIKRWVKAAMKNKPWLDDGIPTPDYYSRKKMI